MIGQKNLLQYFETVYTVTPQPFTIIVGERGSGRKTIVKEFAKLMNVDLVTVGSKIDDIRNLIEIANKQTRDTIYLIADCDRMSIQAKNSLLKVTEEAPQGAFIVVTLLDINSFPKTLQSRANTVKMSMYSDEDKREYIKQKEYDFNTQELNIIMSVSNTLGDIELLVENGIIDFYDFVQKVFSNIEKVSGANAFKISESISLKSNDTGYPLSLFFRTFINVCRRAMFETMQSCYKDCIFITSKYLQELNINGINEKMLLDCWILDIRKALLRGERL